jgi:hypothetical protein
VAAAAGVLALVGMLAWFDPARHGFYPRCYFKALTGLSCPGCGGLRAAHQLLHGNLREAFALNPLLFIMAPLLVWVSLAEGLRALWGFRLSHPFRHPAWLWVVVCVLAVFAVLRNLPVGPFAVLTP